MEIQKEADKVTFKDFLENLIKLSGKTIRPRRFILLHLEHYLLDFLFRERGRQYLIFHLSYLWDIPCMGFHHSERVLNR